MRAPAYGRTDMIAVSEVQVALGLLSGSLVGFSLGLVGGGGSILAVPLMVYVVGVTNPHIAIGTSAIAVAANAAVNLANHARSGHVKWPCAAVCGGWRCWRFWRLNTRQIARRTAAFARVRIANAGRRRADASEARKSRRYRRDSDP